MAHKLTVIRLTNNQKKVLVRITNAPTEVVAGTEISKTSQLATARDMLVRLGLIEYDNKNASVTDEGKQVMTDENLIDDSGELTEEGNKFAYEEGEGEAPEGGEGDELGTPMTGDLMQDVNQAAGPPAF